MHFKSPLLLRFVPIGMDHVVTYGPHLCKAARCTALVELNTVDDLLRPSGRRLPWMCKKSWKRLFRRVASDC
ncbi:MAG: hypothetical protein ACK5ZC_03390 [Pirellulaceae bacterium]